jgi:threonine/homoserine/homoserine lactone efflux protein
MFETTALLTYLVAALALVVAPGPGQALVVARTLEGGTRAGLWTGLGLEIGTLAHTVAAAFGLSAILATSATAFAVLKYAGAAYLVVLGVLALRNARRAAPPAVATARSRDGGRLVAHAAMTGILNPKVALFFLAFLPQFVDPAHGAVLAQFLVLGVLLAAIGMAWDVVVAVSVGRARARVAASARFAAWRERIMGSVLIALGLRLASAERG